MSTDNAKHPTIYRGWHIGRGPDHPVTGQWRAGRNGIGMSATTLEQLLKMIDLRVEDDIATGWRKPELPR